MANALTHLLKQRIAASGPMSLADYMAKCLMHPDYGYYTRQEAIGKSGDFITSPEISQMFGELIGLALAHYWSELGQPEHIALVELGPGRGTLMADILRASKKVVGFHDALHIFLLESSPLMRERQKSALKDYHITWIDQIDQMPDLPLLLVANEFFDALPIYQFYRVKDGWTETMVGVKDGHLVLCQSPVSDFEGLERHYHQSTIGDIIELSPASCAIAHHIGAHIDNYRGLALVIDYGDFHLKGDTFQALQGHQYADPLENPGKADLSAHIDFGALAHAAFPAHYAYTTQAMFLEELGINIRAHTLAQQLCGPALENHHQAHHRLTHSDEMGSLFKVLGLYPKAGPLPAGFANALTKN